MKAAQDEADAKARAAARAKRDAAAHAKWEKWAARERKDVVRRWRLFVAISKQVRGVGGRADGAVCGGALWGCDGGPLQ